mmetsp:Transcript_11166/g.41737  ORF Transcript_11166/g.41737 Transcript_11166/m.41737 type:complete len:505 (-) Transcript_11166:1861-3375(-)
MRIKWSKQLPRFLLGITLLLCVCCVWVLSSQLIQTIFEDLQFDQPFFLTYFSTTMFALYLPLIYLTGLAWQWISQLAHSVLSQWRTKRAHQEDHHSSSTGSLTPLPISEGPPHFTDTPLTSTRATSLDLSSSLAASLKPQKSHHLHRHESISYIIVSALILCPLWLWQNFAFNASLKRTSVSSNTVISNTSSAFCFLSGVVVGVDNFSFTRIFSIVLALGGVIWITFQDSDQLHGADDSFLGDLLAAISAVCYGVYTSALCFLLDPPSVHLTPEGAARSSLENTSPLSHDEIHTHPLPPHSELVSHETVSTHSASLNGDDTFNVSSLTKSSISDAKKMMLLFGFIGVINGCTAWIVLLVAHYTHVERFRMIPSWNVFFSLFLNALIGTVLSDFLWAWSVLLTSGVVSTLSLCLTIPLAALTDVILGKKEMQPSFLIGALIVIIAFLICNLSYYFPESVRRYDSPTFLQCSKKTLHRWYWRKYVHELTEKLQRVHDPVMTPKAEP